MVNGHQRRRAGCPRDVRPPATPNRSGPVAHRFIQQTLPRTITWRRSVRCSAVVGLPSACRCETSCWNGSGAIEAPAALAAVAGVYVNRMRSWKASLVRRGYCRSSPGMGQAAPR